MADRERQVSGIGNGTLSVETSAVLSEPDCVQPDGGIVSGSGTICFFFIFYVFSKTDGTYVACVGQYDQCDDSGPCHVDQQRYVPGLQLHLGSD